MNLTFVILIGVVCLLIGGLVGVFAMCILNVSRECDADNQRKEG